MKTTFKKSMAALSAAAVVAASAAVFAVPANAAGGTLTVGTVTLTLEELQAANYEVKIPVDVAGSGGWYSLGYGVSFNVAEVTISRVINGAAVQSAQNDYGYDVARGTGINNDLGILWLGYAVTPSGSTINYVQDGGVSTIVFKVNANAKAGDVYDLTALVNNGDTYQEINTADGKSASSLVSGQIIIAGEDTTTSTTTTTTSTKTTTTTTTTTTSTTTTTEEPTTTTTTSTTTTPEATTTTTTASIPLSGIDTTTTTTSTTKATTTTTAKKGSTESPKTGDVLPVAGAAAALVVIGGVALVAKKRK
ncbi:MAG: hypothetical protein J6B17_00210 [Ruminococcus sp.]|nr:hypothetical protein [Ruminococcus sp.]